MRQKRDDGVDVVFDLFCKVVIWAWVALVLAGAIAGVAFLLGDAAGR